MGRHGGGAGQRAYRRLPRLAVGGALFAALLAVYAFSSVRTSYDSRWSIHTAASLLAGRWGELSAFEPVLAENGYYAIERQASGLYSLFPIGVSVLALPFVGLTELVDPTFAGALRSSVPAVYESVIASILAALAAVAFYALARSRGAAHAAALAAAAICAFATPMWSTASRALWQHGPQVLMLVLAMLLLERARRRPELAQYASLPLAAAFVIRPTSAIEIAVLSLYVFVAHKGQTVRYLAWSLPIALPWLAYNVAVHEALLPSYYLAGRLGSLATLPEALAGNLASPARGLLVYSPILALAAWGACRDLRRPERFRLSLAFAAIPVLHWVAVSLFAHWWAGHSYGPRFMTEAMPFLAYFLLPVFEHLPALRSVRRGAALALVVLLAAVSAAMHGFGAVSQRGYAWNVVPEDVDRHPERLWSWEDPPFLRGL